MGEMQSTGSSVKSEDRESVPNALGRLAVPRDSDKEAGLFALPIDHAGELHLILEAMCRESEGRLTLVSTEIPKKSLHLDGKEIIADAAGSAIFGAMGNECEMLIQFLTNVVSQVDGVLPKCGQIAREKLTTWARSLLPGESSNLTAEMIELLGTSIA